MEQLPLTFGVEGHRFAALQLGGLGLQIQQVPAVLSRP
jgi:hypothetical protein